MRKTINKLLNLTGYQVKKSKYLYDPNKNLVQSINYFRINSVVDVGANKGQFALNLIENKFNGSIISFEPLKEEHEILKKICKKVKIKWEIAERCALGNKKKVQKLNITGNRESSSLLKIKSRHIKLRPDSKIVGSDNIKVKKIDDFFKNFSKFKKNILLKIDTQGTELDILKGAKKFLPKVKCIFLEVSLVKLYEKQTLWFEVINYLEKRNFKVWSIDPMLRNKSSGQTYQLDILFYKK